MDRIAGVVPTTVAVGEIVNSVSKMDKGGFGEVRRSFYGNFLSKADHVIVQLKDPQFGAGAASCIKIRFSGGGIGEDHSVDRFETGIAIVR